MLPTALAGLVLFENMTDTRIYELVLCVDLGLAASQLRT